MAMVVATKDGRRLAGEALRTLRNEAGYDSNAALARAMGRKTNWVQSKVSGTTDPTADELAEFAAVLGVPTWLLLADRRTLRQWLADHGDDLRTHRRTWRRVPAGSRTAAA